MGKKRTAIQPPSEEALEALVTGLEEIEALFQLVGFSGGKIHPSDETSSEESALEPNSAEDSDDDYDDEDSDSYGSGSFDREEIEVAIDAFISHLIDEKVLKKRTSGKLPSFSEVFGKLFGEDSEVTKTAKNFEEYIEGYFGAITYEDMRAAHCQFLQIQEFIQKKARVGSNVAN